MKYLIPALLVLCISCQGGKENSSGGAVSLKDLKEEVIAIHDEVMPKMGDLRRARKSLMLQADSIMESDSAKATMLNALANNIGDANEGMMAWMRAYEPEFEGTDEEIRTYLEEQKKSIQKVKDDMNKSLFNGLDALN